ncbi:VOC family protein [Bacillus sp. NPDC077027]|uniref:VOC family protein n=1 Tax=Bacillus sp. NPDC077027 TaxID=3390548 RepID=UPI003CFEA2AD
MEFQQFQAAQLRIARPTVKMNEAVSFYEEGLGLKRIGSFDQHEGYDGVMFGLPHQHVHLEITKHEEEDTIPVPHPEQLLVFYIPDKQEFEMMKHRLISFGGQQVPSVNPYWNRGGVTFEDPDGYRIVLMNTEGITTNI